MYSAAIDCYYRSQGEMCTVLASYHYQLSFYLLHKVQIYKLRAFQVVQSQVLDGYVTIIILLRYSTVPH